jgi:hypothetical protein
MGYFMAYPSYGTHLYDNYAVGFYEREGKGTGSITDSGAKAHIIIILIGTEALLLTLWG